MEGTWLFWMQCEICGDERSAVVPDRSLRRLSSGGFAPLPCGACGARSAKPGRPPWQLTASDRKFLRSLRITAST
jgi:hypothetical protein